MSSLPGEIIENIFLRLEVKNLLPCRCVCKPWRDLICSPNFIYKHLNLSIQDNNCTLMFLYLVGSEYNLFYTVDYNPLMSSLASSPTENYECDEAVQMDYPLNSTDYRARILGSCNGLLCVHSAGSPCVITIWNPSSNEYKQLPEPSNHSSNNIDYYGFNYDYQIDDYKVVRIVDYIQDQEDPINSDVEVYTSRSNSWKSIRSIPYYFPSDKNCGVILNGALHWLGVGTDDGEDLIVAFDISEETFEGLAVIEGPVLHPPESDDEVDNNSLGVLGGCLSLLYKVYGERVDVWVMQEYGVKESWNKRFTITQDNVTEDYSLRLVRNFENGGQILLMADDCIIYYDANRKSEKEVVIPGDGCFVGGDNFVPSLVSLYSGTYMQ
ncbi:F-box protein CPR1-like [Papaver somniferum]|uniref:F-box protein CPR1-like n=1 Tax=Papaver somniferum TaxID=3469 RepID=UPI000E6F8F4C|nr:F-box protein CPR1-like [Papaver somniferum]